MEPRFGEAGIGEKILKKKAFSWISDLWKKDTNMRLGRFLECYAEALRSLVKDKNVEVVEHLTKGQWSDLDEALQKGSAVMLGTSITPSGHFLCLVDIKWVEGKKYYTVLDSWGNALSKPQYADHNGERVVYDSEWLKARCGLGADKGRFCRFLYLKQLGI
ncbi:hypothetical protein CH373_13560 [Leptospira perolatii]|uniref:Peptidase C39-like domain-containing protein n=1 Tax=Leptospira perolatii TaxID=2023191 RepID=A0A2M9ZL65_9LEPT|nr:hypothetical protein [Leptospira perolatii]PJZ69868.1 hypothetical protein CH360_08125 [Leptospira perolatii]PJZ72724.1 hypothetical protein CH373_13560 [Leptospira perolatii]